eukprot:TRINITY_DN28726_c0_g1_i1.p1 TRINITY_DN28726_c0_g1~~TRINITY_DN28726_c0_g1_i1.p1  ORF type:complete len:334 (+),score=106.97 TRINITY_DN28726_c0_g1_i1:129-1130(+)
MVVEENHLLSAAAKVWKDVAPELQDPPPGQYGGGAAAPADGIVIAPDELKKVVKWVQHTTTKYGASASVADGADRDNALRPIAEEVIKAYTAALGTLLSMRIGAGPSLLLELREAGAGLANAVESLGAASATEGDDRMAMCAGKVLDKAKALEKVSTQNRAAVRRRLLRALAQLRDAHRELKETLAAPPGESSNAEGDDDDEEDSDLDETLEPEERRILESVGPAVQSLEEVLAEASTGCAPVTDGSTAVPFDALEAAAASAASSATAVDGVVSSSSGGIDVPALRQGMQDLQHAVPGLAGAAPVAGATLATRVAELEAVVAEVSAAVEAEGA